jgi:hypothetical protein
MSEHKTTKRPDILGKATKRPRSLRALVAAVGASAIGLLGMPSAFANTTGSAPTIAVGESTTQSRDVRAKLRLNTVGSQIQLAGGGGHTSHASHESHASHASHSSGGYR